MPSLFLPTHNENQVSMAAYMRDQFEFLGVKSVERRRLAQPIIRASRQLAPAELQRWLAFYYQQPYREYQYVAIDMALANVQRFTPSLYEWCLTQVTTKPWWDSVDAWRKVLATYIFDHDALSTLGQVYLVSDDLWLRRIGLTLQLGRKQKTKRAYLKATINENYEDDEFFIQKAIGWALRDFSKTDPDWVRDVMTTIPLSKLAIREGQKYL